MDKVITEDGSVTYFSEEFQEHYHTKSGAMEEAEVKHLAPTKKFFKNNVVVLDYCFGLGYNSIVAMEYATRKGFDITIYALENDLEIIQELENVKLEEKYEPYRKLILESLENNNSLHIENINFILLLGDARETVNEVPENSVDIVFFDPFSPRQCPELWTEGELRKVYKAMSQDSILTTYSCARKVRDAMEEVGFDIIDGPVVGRRSPSTLAYKK